MSTAAAARTRRAQARHVSGEMYGILLSEREGGEAVGLLARIASRVAVVTGESAVGGTGNGE
jgi:hypothetical protein